MSNIKVPLPTQYLGFYVHYGQRAFLGCKCQLMTMSPQKYIDKKKGIMTRGNLYSDKDTQGCKFSDYYLISNFFTSTPLKEFVKFHR